MFTKSVLTVIDTIIPKLLFPIKGKRHRRSTRERGQEPQDCWSTDKMSRFNSKKKAMMQKKTTTKNNEKKTKERTGH